MDKRGEDGKGSVCPPSRSGCGVGFPSPSLPSWRDLLGQVPSVTPGAACWQAWCVPWHRHHGLHPALPRLSAHGEGPCSHSVLSKIQQQEQGGFMSLSENLLCGWWWP